MGSRESAQGFKKGGLSKQEQKKGENFLFFSVFRLFFREKTLHDVSFLLLSHSLFLPRPLFPSSPPAKKNLFSNNHGRPGGGRLPRQARRAGPFRRVRGKERASEEAAGAQQGGERPRRRWIQRRKGPKLMTTTTAAREDESLSCSLTKEHVSSRPRLATSACDAPPCTRAPRVPPKARARVRR